MSAETKDETWETLVSSIRQLTDTLEDLLKYGRDVVKESTDDFVNGKIGKMFGMATGYQKCFNRVGVKTKGDLERLIQKNSRHTEVREVSHDLLDIEQDWDTFLADVDKSLQVDNSNTVTLGETGPHEISANNGRVIVVSFGIQEGATHWLQDTQAPFTMLLDKERRIYHAFGLQRSVLKVWCVESLVFYAEALVTGKPLPKHHENVHDDTQQMGGDFILDSSGVVRFLYPSKTNTDRPSVAILNEELKKLQTTKK